MRVLSSYHFNVMQCVINYKINNLSLRRIDPVSGGQANGLFDEMTPDRLSGRN